MCRHMLGTPGSGPNQSGFLKDGEVLVVVLKTTDASILAGCVAEGECIRTPSRCGPSSLVEVAVRGGILESSGKPVPSFVWELSRWIGSRRKEVSSKVVRHSD